MIFILSQSAGEPVFLNMKSIGIILAAGKGTRMRSHLPKPLVPFKNKPIVAHLLDSMKEADIDPLALIVGYQSEVIESHFAADQHLHFIHQHEQLGTAHAIVCALPFLENQTADDVVVVVGDSPLLHSATLRALIAFHRVKENSCSFLSADFSIALPYARIIRGSKGEVVKVVEERVATPEEKKVTELLSSHFVFDREILCSYIKKVPQDSTTGEYYLTDIIGLILQDQLAVGVLKISDYRELVGLNTPEDIAWAESVIL